MGRIDVPETRHDPAGLAVSADCAECVVAYYQDRLEWWTVAGEPQLLEVRRTYDGPGRCDGIDHVIPSPDRRLMAVMCEDGCQLWDAAARAPVGDPLPGVESVAFAPSGRRLVACVDPDLENPGNKRIASLWEIAES